MPAAGDTDDPEDPDVNDNSLVFRLVHGRFAILFTGDIGIATEEELVSAPASLGCTVLKVPHHGSRHSSSAPFLDASSPAIALIGAGYRNSFRLPARETLVALKGRGIRVWRTDLDGTVRITSDGGGGTPLVEGLCGHFH